MFEMRTAKKEEEIRKNTFCSFSVTKGDKFEKKFLNFQ